LYHGLKPLSSKICCFNGQFLSAGSMMPKALALSNDDFLFVGKDLGMDSYVKFLGVVKTFRWYDNLLF